jgi:hypothetical protein
LALFRTKPYRIALGVDQIGTAEYLSIFRCLYNQPRDESDLEVLAETLQIAEDVRVSVWRPRRLPVILADVEGLGENNQGAAQALAFGLQRIALLSQSIPQRSRWVTQFSPK